MLVKQCNCILGTHQWTEALWVLVMLVAIYFNSVTIHFIVYSVSNLIWNHLQIAWEWNNFKIKMASEMEWFKNNNEYIIIENL